MPETDAEVRTRIGNSSFAFRRQKDSMKSSSAQEAGVSPYINATARLCTVLNHQCMTVEDVGRPRLETGLPGRIGATLSILLCWADWKERLVDWTAGLETSKLLWSPGFHQELTTHMLLGGTASGLVMTGGGKWASIEHVYCLKTLAVMKFIHIFT